MAGCDYFSCAVCGGKTFYDAQLHYPSANDPWPDHSFPDGLPVGAFKMAALCQKCAATHDITVVASPQPRSDKEGG